ncbi:MAG: hypothetical protein PHP71_05675 [Methanosarcina sp.]|nr:hypothetical protein [Methanosarcina sp.]MDD4524147.1 hypothetical protein [Methanosarcina sp.]
MLPEKVVLEKLTFTPIKNPKNKEKLGFLLLIPIFLCLIVSPGAAASSSWELAPENPVVGDTIEIKGTGFEGDTVKVLVTFEKEVQVLDGRYEYLLEDIEIPGFDNSFTVQAIGANDLNVRAKMLLWITKTAEAKDGIATVSQAGVPPGTYKIRIDGKASDSKVRLKITASQGVEVDSGGSFSYKYDTKSIPAGNFEVKVEGITKQIDLQPAKGLPSVITPSQDQNLSKEINEGIKEETNEGITKENVEKKNTSGEEKKSIEKPADLKSQKIWIAGILTGLVLLLVYLRRR